jgi:NAD(P) transhydrogenase subunit alpha
MKSLLALTAVIAMSAPAQAAGLDAIDPRVFLAGIFVLACFVGYYVVWSVTPALHTPLMSVTNAISAVVVVGALIAAAAAAIGGAEGETTRDIWIARGLGGGAVFLAAINIFGGFLVTQRMLAMYKKK